MPRSTSDDDQPLAASGNGGTADSESPEPTAGAVGVVPAPGRDAAGGSGPDSRHRGPLANRRPRVSKSTIYGWRTTSYGPPAIKVGKHLCWRPEVVVAWAEKQELSEE